MVWEEAVRTVCDRVLTEALPKMAEAASNPELAEAFRNHLEQTEEHISRLEAVFRSWNNPRAQEYRRIYDSPDSIGTAER